MQTRLRSIAAALVPAFGIALGAVAMPSNAAMRADVAALVGVNVTDGNGRRFGTVQNVMLDDDGRMATLLVKKRNHETEALRVDIDAAVAARRGTDLILLVGEGDTRYSDPAPGRYVEPAREVYAGSEWSPRIKMSTDARLNRLLGVTVVDWNGRSLGQVESVATANFGQGEKAYAIVEPHAGTKPLVVPLGDFGRVIDRVDAPDRLQADEIVVNREDGIGYITMPAYR